MLSLRPRGLGSSESGTLAYSKGPTHRGSRVLVVLPGALQGCLVHCRSTGDEGSDVEHSGSDIEDHELVGRENRQHKVTFNNLRNHGTLQ